MKFKIKKWWIINSILLLIFFLIIIFYTFIFVDNLKQNTKYDRPNIILKENKIIKLNNIIKKTSLGDFTIENLEKPTEQQIKERLKKLNPQLNIDKINVENIVTTNATIVSNDNSVYDGKIVVKYTNSLNSLNW